MFVSKTPYIYPTLYSGALNEFGVMECVPISVLLLKETREKNSVVCIMAQFFLTESQNLSQSKWSILRNRFRF